MEDDAVQCNDDHVVPNIVCQYGILEPFGHRMDKSDFTQGPYNSM